MLLYMVRLSMWIKENKTHIGRVEAHDSCFATFRCKRGEEMVSEGFQDF